MNIPTIDFEFWFNKNFEISKSREKKIYINRHHAVATQILNKFKDENIRIAYFTQYNDERKIQEEYKRIKSLTYYELEGEILSNAKKIIEESFKDKDLILQTFDLIQIWGGKPGGNNIYNRSGIDRINFDYWIETYIKGIKLASFGDFESYEILKSIKHLQLPFASKHVNFFSRHLGIESLIIIDEKISHCFKTEEANSISIDQIKEINYLCREAANNFKYHPWQIEKALFSFHSNYFKAKNLISTKYNSPQDIGQVEILKKWYDEIKSDFGNKSNNTNRFKKNIKIRKQQKVILGKDDYFRNNSGEYFIKNLVVDSIKILSKLIDQSKYLKFKETTFYKYIGDPHSIVFHHKNN
jgi:hypothetical protein